VTKATIFAYITAHFSRWSQSGTKHAISCLKCITRRHVQVAVFPCLAQATETAVRIWTDRAVMCNYAQVAKNGKLRVSDIRS